MDTKQFRLPSSLVSVMECPIGTMFKDHLFPVPSIHHHKSPGIHGNGLYIQAHLLQINSTHPFHFLNPNKQVVLTKEFHSSFLSVFSMWTACHVSTYITVSLSGLPPLSFPAHGIGLCWLTPQSLYLVHVHSDRRISCGRCGWIFS